MTASICRDCLFDTRNDFYEPGFDDRGMRVDVCACGKMVYPHAHSCDRFDAAMRDLESYEQGRGD